ncbi:MAG: hypothetical protein LBE79_00050, partial [Tannerella sp.]|nr:hypothetical protein [Tannerella sp.]
MNNLNPLSSTIFWKICCLVFFFGGMSHSSFGQTVATIDEVNRSPVEYINSNFENASPVFWDYNPDGSVRVHMLYDKERNSPNRAN